MHPNPVIYQPDFVRELFNEMSGTYEKMNTITSFGFSERWRRQCVDQLELKNGMRVVDLMTGMGEAWLYILPKIGKNGQLVALDFCQPMLDFAKKRQQNFPKNSIEILCENALQSSILDGSADAVISTFGLKTLSPEQLENFAIEIFRVLKPGGTFSMVEVSVPKNAVLQAFYLF